MFIMYYYTGASQLSFPQGQSIVGLNCAWFVILLHETSDKLAESAGSESETLSTVTVSL